MVRAFALLEAQTNENFVSGIQYFVLIFRGLLLTNEGRLILTSNIVTVVAGIITISVASVCFSQILNSEFTHVLLQKAFGTTVFECALLYFKYPDPKHTHSVYMQQ